MIPLSKHLRPLIALAVLLISLIASGQEPFGAMDKKELRKLIRQAKNNGEAEGAKVDKMWSEFEDAKEMDTSANAVFDYGRMLTELLQPGLSKATETPLSEASKKLVLEAEKAYSYAIDQCDCHGRANIMLGLLYNQQGNYFASEGFLEKGLQLKEGSDDWMVAANQYLLAGAYTYNTDTPKYQEVYEKFKIQVHKVIKNKAYYLKMAGMYKPYYEGN